MKFILIAFALIGAAYAYPTIRIVGGQNATRGEFPWQISYQYGLLNVWSHICGGTVLSKNWILTAGHCVTEVPSIGNFKIVAGILDLDDTVPEKQELTVVEKIVHPDYKGGVGPNDLALLRLGSPLELNDDIVPAKLPENGSVASGDVLLSGWGSMGGVIIPILPNRLQKATLPVIPNDECNEAIQALSPDDNPFDLDSNICTGPLSGGYSACSGDSGGPLVQDGVIVGIVSWGYVPCGAAGAPSVYTKVENFLDFIKENVNDL